MVLLKKSPFLAARGTTPGRCAGVSYEFRRVPGKSEMDCLALSRVLNLPVVTCVTYPVAAKQPLIPDRAMLAGSTEFRRGATEAPDRAGLVRRRQ